MIKIVRTAHYWDGQPGVPHYDTYLKIGKHNLNLVVRGLGATGYSGTPFWIWEDHKRAKQSGYWGCAFLWVFEVWSSTDEILFGKGVNSWFEKVWEFGV